MNKIKFNQTGGFPLDTNVLGFMQAAYQLFNVLGELAGNLSILQGCQQTGTNVSDGVVYINGEILPFKGGAGSKVIIKSEKTSLQFEDGSSHEVEELRYATFGLSSTSYKWSDFKRLDNIQKLMHDLETHKHQWSEIQNKPNTFPPDSHSHNWDSITGKPSAFPPDEHSHSYNDLTDKPDLGGQIVVAGKVGYSPRRVMKKFAGNFTVAAYPRVSDSACHKITHNLGHTDYVVTGSAVGNGQADGTTIKFNCFYASSNYCYVCTADDDTWNPSDFIFQITSFR